MGFVRDNNPANTEVFEKAYDYYRKQKCENTYWIILSE